MPGNALLPGHGACSRQQRKVQGIQGQEDSICMRRWRQVQEEAHGYQALCVSRFLFHFKQHLNFTFRIFF